MQTATRKARNSLLWLAFYFVAIGSILSYGHFVKGDPLTPGLGLDLAGGKEIILTASNSNGTPVDAASLQLAVDVIRKRVDGSGVAEAQIVTQAPDTIIVSMPGNPEKATLDLIETPAQLLFRPVIYVASVDQTFADAVNGGTATAEQQAEVASSGLDAVKSGTALPDIFGTDPLASLTNGTASSYSWVDDSVKAQWLALDCTTVAGRGTIPSTLDKDPFVTCGDPESSTYYEKYVLGPVEMTGNDIASAGFGPRVGATGNIVGNQYQVTLSFKSYGKYLFGEITGRLFKMATSPRDRFAMTLDGLVISAPSPSGALTQGTAVIERTTPPMLRPEAERLGNQLKYGALPLNMTFQSSNDVSASLGKEQLQRGLLAGAIGLILVVFYSILQYRALAAVTIGSLVIAGSLTFGSIDVFSNILGYRLSLAGVAGVIVSIGITADSFIVYFERVRDELREGRSLAAAVEHGWGRARRTIIAADSVSMLAAIVLYLTAVGGVRGFAFTLGLTTIIDLLVVTMFTHPMLILVSRTKFFGGGHRFSGLDPRLLGVGTTYKGRGRVVVGPTIAERKAGIKGGDAR